MMSHLVRAHFAMAACGLVVMACGSETDNDAGTAASTQGGGGTTAASTGGTGAAGGMDQLCGNGVVDVGEACDGADLGGASCSELGFSNPAGVQCSAACTLDTSACTNTCGDGVVEPGELCDDNNATSDDGCTACAPDGSTCEAPIPIALTVAGASHAGTTTGAPASEQPLNTTFVACSSFSALGPDRTYAVTPAV